MGYREWGLLAALVPLAGCGTYMGDGGPFVLRTEPESAVVVVNGDTVGRTPLRFLPGSGDPILVSAPLHQDHRMSVTRRFNPWVLGNVLIAIGGAAGLADPSRQEVEVSWGMIALGLAGLAWDYRGGALWSYEPARQFVPLEPEPEPEPGSELESEPERY